MLKLTCQRRWLRMWGRSPTAEAQVFQHIWQAMVMHQFTTLFFLPVYIDDTFSQSVQCLFSWLLYISSNNRKIAVNQSFQAVCRLLNLKIVISFKRNGLGRLMNDLCFSFVDL